MDHLETEGRNPASERLDDLSALELVRLMVAEDARIVPAVASQEVAIASAIEVIADRLRRGGRLVYIGAGTSGRLGVLDASECPPTFSTPPGLVVGLIAGGAEALTRAVEGAEDHPEQAERDLAAINFSAADVLVGIATSGRTPYVLGGVRYARGLGAFTVGVACTSSAELSAAVDLPIVPVVGPEILSGSTRMKAGTATKLVLNTLTTGAMVLLGKTFGNLMVDLRATNSKLRARTNRIVRQLTGLDHDSAADLLARCGGELKTALVSQLAGLEPEAARQRLAESGGQVRPALPPRRRMVDRSLTIGIDGGGSHTVALLAKDGVVIGRGESGPSNRQAVGDARAHAALDEAIARAFAAAGLPRVTARASCLGLAGSGRPADRQAIQAWAERAGVAERVEVVTDAALLLAAGTPAGWGVAVVAGTGSIAWGRGPDGREERGGGWGYLLGDEGSGYAIAMDALRAVTRAADGTGPATRLDGLLDRLSVSSPREIVPLVYGGALDRPALAALAPHVIALADEDEVARGIIEAHAAALARTVSAVVGRIGLNRRPFPLALAGGLAVGCESYRQALVRCLYSSGERPDPITVVREPATGALRLVEQEGQE